MLEFRCFIAYRNAFRISINITKHVNYALSSLEENLQYTPCCLCVGLWCVAE